MSLHPWIFVGLFFIASAFLPSVAIGANWLLGPKRPNRVKHEPYECGVEMIGSPWAQFRAQWYVFALVYVVFDVEVIFLFPWAKAYNQMGLFALFEVTVFVVLLLVALWYVSRKDALEWS